MMDEWVRFNMQLRPKMAAALDEEADEIGISRSDLIKVIISNHLKTKDE